MPRLLRYSLPGVPQHVIQRGHNRQPIFFQEDDYRFYLTCLQETTARHATAVHAYVLMTKHVHVLMTPPQPNSIAKVMQALGRRYVPYINAMYQRTKEIGVRLVFSAGRPHGCRMASRPAHCSR